MSVSLDWSDVDDFGVSEATDGPWRFVVWQGRGESGVTRGELRLIRRENVGGIIAPLQDISIYTPDANWAVGVAEGIAQVLRTVQDYNTLTPLA